MRALTFSALSSIALGAHASAWADDWCQFKPVRISHQDDVFYDFVQGFYTDKNVSEALHMYAVADYIQHNPFVGQGAQATIDYLGPLLPMVNLTLLHVGKDGDSGFVHYKLDRFGPEPTALVDVDRLNGSCIVEHWDVIDPLALF